MVLPSHFLFSSKKKKKFDFYCFTTYLLPISDGHHWYMIVLTTEEENILFWSYDSKNTKILDIVIERKNILELLQAKLVNECTLDGKSIIDDNIISDPECWIRMEPKQTDTYSCGHRLLYATREARNYGFKSKIVTVQPSDIYFIRITIIGLAKPFVEEQQKKRRLK
jgi:Ulp1 family protease